MIAVLVFKCNSVTGLYIADPLGTPVKRFHKVFYSTYGLTAFQYGEYSWLAAHVLLVLVIVPVTKVCSESLFQVH